MTSNAELDKFRFVFRKKQDGHTLSVYDGKTLIGKMGAMTADRCYPDDSPLAKYRKHANVVSAEILEPYRGRKLYQEMLLRFRKHAKEELGCAGLKSEEFQRSAMATRAWKKLDPRIEVKGDEKFGREDLFLDGLGGLGGRITTKQREALDYARRAASALYAIAPDLVRNKCETNSSLFARLLRRQGYKVKVVTGVLPKGGPHVWLEVEGKRFDPTLEPQCIRARYGPGEKSDAPKYCNRTPALEDRYADKIEELLQGGVNVFMGPAPLKGLPTRGRIPLKTAQRALKKLPAKTRACGFTPAELREGMEVEREHRDVTKGRVLDTAKVAAAHLCESRRYYTELKKLERKLKR